MRISSMLHESLPVSSNGVLGFNSTPLSQWAFRFAQPCLGSHEASTLLACVGEFE
jgi:hypothetical protein